MGVGYALSACADGALPTEPPVRKTPITLPAAPVIPEVVAGNRQLSVAYVAPANDGGSQITGYSYSIDAGSSWTAVQAPTPRGVITLDSLENGKGYTIALRAINEVGPGPSAIAHGTPSTTPSQPKVTGIVAGDKKLTVLFTLPDSGGARILGYEYSVDGGTRWARTDSALSSPLVISGLANGTSYPVCLRAINGAGAGPASEIADATPMTVPGVPVVAGVEPAIDKLIVRMHAPADNGGSALTGYEYSLDSGQHWVAVGELESGSFQIAGLSWQVKYIAFVRAKNRAGPGAYAVATGTPRGLAAQPTIVQTTPGDGEVVVEFAKPAHFGGAEFMEYQFSLDSGSTWTASAAAVDDTRLRISELRNGNIYMLALRAVTPWGAGMASGAVRVMPFVPSPRIDSVRVIRRGGRSLYIPQMLDNRDPGFDIDVARALQRYRTLKGRDAKTLFEKVQAAADYVSNMAKHPYTHNLGKELSDPRTWEYRDWPGKLAELSRENQQWNGLEWIPAEGKTLDDVPAIECSFQDFILGGLVNALGTQWMLIGIAHHDAFTYYDNELGKWVYIDATYNEHYRSPLSAPDNYVPLSPLELRQMNLAGDNSMIAVREPYQSRRIEPEYILLPYVQMNPLGFSSMMTDVNGISNGERLQRGEHLRVIPGGSSETSFAAFISLGWVVAEPDEDPWAPQGETFVESLASSARGNVVRLSTNLAASSVFFERQVNGGAWVAVGAESELNGFVGEIRFRARGAEFAAGMVVLHQAAK